MKIKQGDKVLIISGKYKGKTGSVMRTYEKNQKVTVEKINIITRHIKKTASAPGQRIQYEAPFSASNVLLICPSCDKATRVGYKVPAAKAGKVDSKGKMRICKKCGKSVEQAAVKTETSKSKKK